MNKKALLNLISFVETEKVGIELYFLYREKQEHFFEILRADLEGTVTKTQLENVFVNKIKRQLLNKDSDEATVDWKLKHINEVDDSKNTFYYFPNVDTTDEDAFHVPEEFLEFASIQDKDYDTFKLFKHELHVLENVVSIFVRLRIDNKQILLYKHKFPFDILSKSSTSILKLINIDHKSRFSLEKEQLLQINDKIDFMYVGNSFIIFNLKLLEGRYGFNDRYLKNAKHSIQVIKEKNILIGVEKLEELSQKVSFSKKLMKVKSDNEVLCKPISAIKKFLSEYKTKDGKHSLSKRIKYEPKMNKFQVDTNVAAQDFIRLLSDQFLNSELTNKPYVSESHNEFLFDQD